MLAESMSQIHWEMYLQFLFLINYHKQGIIHHINALKEQQSSLMHPCIKLTVRNLDLDYILIIYGILGTIMSTYIYCLYI
jgi:hypothetical protein